MSVRDLQDCGHVGDLGGVCQFAGCAKQLCQRCVQDCATCGITLCPDDQVWLDDGQQVFCENCSGDYVARKAALFLLDRATGGNG